MTEPLFTRVFIKNRVFAYVTDLSDAYVALRVI